MFTSINPATGEAGTPIPELTADEVEARIARAAATYANWRTTSYDERTALLERIAEAFEADKRRLAEIA
ncbi:aldehyde dehydrogenase family protein, partial [Escherichia coli]|nr:aldehyde dehydrogenase family protein [Escherichia coli]